MLVEVRSARTRPTRRRGLTILEASVADESGVGTATWFNRAWLAERLKPGTKLLARGKLEKRGFTVAEHELLEGSEERAPAGLHTTGIVPVHPASEKLRAQRIREWAWQLVPLARHAVEPLPAAVRSSRRGRVQTLAAFDRIESTLGGSDYLVGDRFSVTSFVTATPGHGSMRCIAATAAARRRSAESELRKRGDGDIIKA